MRNKKPNKTLRLNLLVTETFRDDIRELQARAGASDIAEVIRRALFLYDHMLAVREQGGEIIVRVNDREDRIEVV